MLLYLSFHQGTKNESLVILNKSKNSSSLKLTLSYDSASSKSNLFLFVLLVEDWNKYRVPIIFLNIDFCWINQSSLVESSSPMILHMELFDVFNYSIYGFAVEWFTRYVIIWYDDRWKRMKFVILTITAINISVSDACSKNKWIDLIQRYTILWTLFYTFAAALCKD